MFCDSPKSKALFLILTVIALCAFGVQAQESTPITPSGASVTLLDSTREQDGLFGSVRRVKVQTAKLEMKAGRPLEGPLQLLELTTYSVAGNRIENISYPVPATSVGKEEYKYDDKGQIVEMTLRGDDGSILSREKYSYELDTFGNWTKMVTSLIVFEDGQLRFEPVEVTYRTLAYYFNDTVAQMVDSNSHQMLAAPRGVTISNSAVTKPLAESTKREPLLGAIRVGKKAAGTKDEPEPIEKMREITSPPTRKEGASPNFLTEIRNAPAKVPVSGNGRDAAPVSKPRNTAAGATEAGTKNISEASTKSTSEASTKSTDPVISAEQKMAFEFYKRGREFFDSGAMNGAIEAYQKSINLEPNSAEVHLSLGQAYLRLKQDQQALKSFKRATTLNPDLAEAFYGLGLVQFNLRHHRDAAKAFKQATVANPKLAKAHYGLALAYQELGEENLVIAEFRILETLDPGLAKKLADTFPEFNLPCRANPFCK